MKKPKARPLQKAKTVVVVSDSIIAFHRNELLLGIAQFVQEHRKYNIKSMTGDEVREIGKDSLEECSGFILSSVNPLDSVVKRLLSTGLPIVGTEGLPEDADVVRIDIDAPSVGRMAAEYFIRHGFRNFAFCGRRDVAVSNEMEKAFAETLSKAGFDYLPSDTSAPFSDDDRQRGRLHMKQFAKRLPRNTAVLCMTDLIASDFQQTCLKLGRAVPSDIAIMGVLNDLALCTSVPVPISSIDVNIRGLGYAAMRLIDAAIRDRPSPKGRPVFRIRAKGITERESTAVYPVDPPWLSGILLLVDENIDRPLSLRDLVKESGLSHTTLQTAFHKTFGMSAGKYILSVKMREAKKFLDEGKLSVKEIAARTGFTSQSYFCRTYLAYYGRTPSRGRPVVQRAI